MRNTIFTLAFILVGGCVFAQKEFRPGIRGGLNFSTIESINASYKAGAYIGVIGSLKMNKFYTLQPELNFSMQGANDVYYGEENVDLKADIPLNYLGLAVMNKFNLKSAFLQVGPSLDFVMNDNVYVNQNIDMSINIGLGYEFTNDFAIEARYKAGVADLIETGSFWFYFDEVNYNSVFQIGLQYKFK